MTTQATSIDALGLDFMDRVNLDCALGALKVIQPRFADLADKAQSGDLQALNTIRANVDTMTGMSLQHIDILSKIYK